VLSGLATTHSDYDGGCINEFVDKQS